MNWQYIGGFFDADGSVSVYKNGGYYRLSVALYQNRPRGLKLLESIRDYTGLGQVIKNRNRHESYALEFYSNEAAIFLRSIAPYTILKRAEVITALAFRETKNRFTFIPERIVELQERFSAQMKRLRGC